MRATSADQAIKPVHNLRSRLRPSSAAILKALVKHTALSGTLSNRAGGHPQRSGGFFYFFDEFGSVHVWNNNVKLHSPQRETSHFPAPSGRRFAKNAKYHIFYLDDVKFHI